jgi:BirA family transcriptional regulator, biotin operon repressor / biotin---[acetyl-CoA-carboxylase] ligase
MKSAVQLRPSFVPAIARPGRRTEPGVHLIAGWQLQVLREVDSTQRLAAELPEWSAVLAGRQTGGRGQRERTFTSDEGGFYLTAVLPYDGRPAAWQGFALAVGWAVREALTKAGVEDLRLRWPNDLMIGPRKVGGILVEQAGRKTLLVGIGLNVSNQPWLIEPGLRLVAGRLVDHWEQPKIAQTQLTEIVLVAIHRAHEEFAAKRLRGLAAVVNGCWGTRHHVRLIPAAGVELPHSEGSFGGIDERGRVCLSQPDGSSISVPAHHIERLIEVD